MARKNVAAVCSDSHARKHVPYDRIPAVEGVIIIVIMYARDRKTTLARISGSTRDGQPVDVDDKFFSPGRFIDA